MTAGTIGRAMCHGDVMAQGLGVLIEYVCDAHVSRDAIGPFITRVDGAWGYCAGHGTAAHLWRRITAIRRELLERMYAKVELLCATKEHIERGLQVPDGHGFLTIAERRWVYCSAALDEPHDWQPVTPVDFREIEHDRVASLIAAAQ
jgi:hypothetical protein